MKEEDVPGMIKGWGNLGKENRHDDSGEIPRAEVHV